MSSMGILLVPLVNGKPLSEQEVLALSPEEKEDLSKRQENIQGHIKEAVTKMRSWDREIKEQVEKIDREVVQFILQTFVEDLERKYSDAPGVSEYLEAVGNDIIENRDLFRCTARGCRGQPVRRQVSGGGVQEVPGECPGGQHECQGCSGGHRDDADLQ